MWSCATGRLQVFLLEVAFTENNEDCMLISPFVSRALLLYDHHEIQQQSAEGSRKTAVSVQLCEKYLDVEL